MPIKPQIVVSVTNDLSTDQRVHRSCLALMNQGFEVILVGRKLPSSLELPQREYTCIRFHLLFHKGPLFYAAYNLRLLRFLLFSKAKALFSNDLDTLPANYLASKFKKIFLAYDSHEFYTGVPELENRPVVRSIWTKIEKWIFPSLQCIITVNDSIAHLYEKLYGKKLIVIRNVPLKPIDNPSSTDKTKLRNELGLPVNKKIVILQGAGI
ncbi:MAG TPA: glycosyltransferase, partial [Bacteroidia bacterium]|nr:glycosyltransferase [Bacteroidia bacterium]